MIKGALHQVLREHHAGTTSELRRTGARSRELRSGAPAARRALGGARSASRRCEPPRDRRAERARRALGRCGAARGRCCCCASVLADSAIEHYRGSFENPAMFAPLVASALTPAAGATRRWRTGGAPAPRGRRLRARRACVGAAGLGFHLYNVLQAPGRLDWLNLFYAAPLGAPAALVLAGVLGAARPTASARAPARPRCGSPARRPGARSAASPRSGSPGTVGEAALLHFRGASRTRSCGCRSACRRSRRR